MDTVTLQLEQTTNEYVPFSLNSPATNNGRLEYFKVSSTASSSTLVYSSIAFTSYCRWGSIQVLQSCEYY